MPQVFGANEIGLIAESSLWVEADFVDDVKAHEDALHDAGFEEGTLPVHIDKEGLGSGSIWGQHLVSDPGKSGHHTWAVARVQNRGVDPNAPETSVGGAKPRYSVEIHRVPKNPTARAQPMSTSVWEGNDIRRFLGGHSGGGMSWPAIQNAMVKGPRK